MREPKDEERPRETSFRELLLYVLGFLGTIALLAFAAVWLIRAL